MFITVDLNGFNESGLAVVKNGKSPDNDSVGGGTLFSFKKNQSNPKVFTTEKNFIRVYIIQ